jgi:hypothetical protein
VISLESKALLDLLLLPLLLPLPLLLFPLAKEVAWELLLQTQLHRHPQQHQPVNCFVVP